MSDHHDMNSFEKQIKEIREDQNSVFQQGYYIGTGRVPLFLGNLFKSTSLMIVVGLILFVPSIFFLLRDFSIESTISKAIPLLIGGILIVGGILRLKNKLS